MAKHPSRELRIRNAFYTAVADKPDTWRCKCLIERKQTGTGYTNLVSHVERVHAQDLKTFLSNKDLDGDSSVSDSLFHNSKTVQVYGWVKLITGALLPFNIVENPIFIQAIKLKPIARKTVSKYITLLTRHVEGKIASRLPLKFALIFDGWSANQAHFVGVFATFPSSNDLGFERILLSLSPFENEENLTADAHMSFLQYFLSVYNRSVANVVCLVGDSCNTNLSLADKCHFNLSGAHRIGST